MIDARLVKWFPAVADSEAFELNVHLQMEAGITVLLGPSGAGKSLTLNCIAGFSRPDQGRILVDDQLYFDAAAQVNLPPRHRRCGYIFQDHALFPHMTIRENLGFAAAAAQPPDGRLHHRRRIRELLDAFELTDLAARKPAELSGGQKQRAAIARILIANPRLLLLDEPTRGLDARLRKGFYEVLRNVRDRLQVPILLVTHDLDECFELADYVCLIERGRFLQSGPKQIVLGRPNSVEVARSLGIYNIIPAEIMTLDPGRNTSRLAVFDSQIEGPYLPGHLIGDRGFICVPQFEMQAMHTDIPRSQNALELRVLAHSASPQGIRLALEHDIIAVVSEAEYRKIAPSGRVYVEIPPAAVYFIESSNPRTS